MKEDSKFWTSNLCVIITVFFIFDILYLKLSWLSMHSAGSLYLSLPRAASLPSRAPYWSGPGASVPAGAPADSPRRAFPPGRAGVKRRRARRSAGSNKWSNYPITSSFTSVRQQNMARRETNRYHLANAVSNIGDVDAQRWASSHSPSEPKQKKKNGNCPFGLLFQTLGQLCLEDRISSRALSRVPRRPCVPAHHQSSLRSLGGEGEVRLGAWERG